MSTQLILHYNLNTVKCFKAVFIFVQAKKRIAFYAKNVGFGCVPRQFASGSFFSVIWIQWNLAIHTQSVPEVCSNYELQINFFHKKQCKLD